MATTIPESHFDLLQGRTAVLATVGPDGRPQLSAVWFLFEDGTIRISLSDDRQKTKNLQANPAITFFILDPANSFRYLEVRGDAHIEPDADYAFGDRIGAKYDTDVRTFDQPGTHRVVVTIEPTRVNAVDMSGG